MTYYLIKILLLKKSYFIFAILKLFLCVLHAEILNNAKHMQQISSCPSNKP